MHATRDEAGRVGGEVGGERGDLIRGAEATEGDVASLLGLERVGVEVPLTGWKLVICRRRSVSIGPGAITLKVMWSGPYSATRDLARAATPARMTFDIWRPGIGLTTPAVEVR